MGGFEYLADGHHVDDAGNLIACTYVDFRDPAERFAITVLQSLVEAARDSGLGERDLEAGLLLDQGEGLTSDGESHYGTKGWIYCASIEPSGTGRSCLTPSRPARIY